MEKNVEIHEKIRQATSFAITEGRPDRRANELS